MRNVGEFFLGQVVIELYNHPLDDEAEWYLLQPLDPNMQEGVSFLNLNLFSDDFHNKTKYQMFRPVPERSSVSKSLASKYDIWSRSINTHRPFITTKHDV